MPHNGLLELRAKADPKGGAHIVIRNARQDNWDNEPAN